MLKILTKTFLIIILAPIIAWSQQTDKTRNKITKAEELFHKGQYHDAEKLLIDIPKTNLKRSLLLCELYMETGQYNKAEELSEVFFKTIDENTAELSASGLLTLAEGLWFYATRKGEADIFHMVNNDILPSIEEIDQTNSDLYSFWGFCYLVKYDIPEAIDYFKKSLKLDPKNSEAHLGMAYCYFYKSPEAARESLKKILSFDPDSVKALSLMASTYLAENKFSDAVTTIEKALKVNPNSLFSLGTLASIYYLTNEHEKFLETEKKVLSVNPKPALFYYILGKNCSSTSYMMYPDAQPFFKKSIELDPHFWDGYVALGINGLKCGPQAEIESRKILEEAFKRDPFNPIVKNTLKVLDAIEEEFETIKTEHFTIKLNRSEAKLLAPYLTDLLEKAYDKFTKLYKFEPDQPLLCEIFPSMNDFSVRMTGLPGVDYALGVCFAKTFLVYSPQVQEKLRKRFHWGGVTIHEFKHIITLQLSNFKVPRWFTEGCSVWSEKLINPLWARKMEMEIYPVYESGKLQHMEKFTERKGFDLIHTYLLSSLIIEYIYQKYGMDKIIAMLKAFGARKTQNDVFKECLGKTMKEFDKEFFDYFENTWIKRIKLRTPPRLQKEKSLLEKLSKNPEDQDALTELARIAYAKGNLLEAQKYAADALAINPENIDSLIVTGEVFYHHKKRRYKKAIEYFSKAISLGASDFGTHFKLALAYMKNDEPDKAIIEFNEAKKCFPNYIKHQDNPYYYLAQIYNEKGETDKATKELEEYVSIAHQDFPSQMELAEIYSNNKQHDKLINLLENTVYLEPDNLKLHAWLAIAYRHKKQYQKALREYQIEIFLLNKREQSFKRDKWLSNFHCDMAEIYVKLKDHEKAKNLAQLALEENQDNTRARKLLDELK